MLAKVNKMNILKKYLKQERKITLTLNKNNINK